jgi:PAS domain S-box-containing protein
MKHGTPSHLGSALLRGSGKSFLICVLSLWLTLSVANALDPNKRLTQYAHTAWRIQDGFLPNTPFWISQSKEGYLWVGNKRSVWRFDGIRFTPWSPPIAATRIRRLVSVRVGEFWIATQSELVHVRDNVVISHYDVPVITGMHEDSDGSMWALSLASTDRILCHATDAGIRCFGKAEGITFHNPLPIIPDGKGGFWIGGDTSLLHWKVGAAPEIYSPKQLRSNVGQDPIHSLVRDSDGSLWVGMESTGPGRGLERFRNGVLTPVVLPNFDGSKLNIEALIQDSDKNLWIATYGSGIYRIHDQTVEHFGRADGLSSDAVFDLYEGGDGIVWAATSNGIDNFRDLPVTTFSTSEGLGRDGANSVMAAKDGTLWVGNLGTLDFIRNGAVSSVRVPGEQVGSLLEDHQGNIWVGVDDGLFIYKDGRFRRITGPDHHPLGLVLGITEDADGNIWAQCKGSQRRLIRIRDFKVREDFPEPPVPPANTIAADPKGGIWLGALTGDLTFFREGIARTFPLNLKGSWAEKTAHQISVDPDGSVITASDTGLVVLRSAKVQRLGKENGLPCDGVTGFAVDDKRNLWLNTPCGFIEIPASDFQRWWIHPDTIVQARVFGTLDGALPGPVTFNPAAKSPDGRLWFVNNVVLQMIDPSHLSGEGTVSPTYIETVVADRKQFKPQEGLHLPPLTRDLQIGYTSPSFLIPQNVKFRYRLDGHDRDWQDAGTRREAFYTDLGPGKYRFRVIASNDNGVWNEAGATLDFAIAPAFYQTVWFRSLIVVLFLAGLVELYRLRLLHLERQRDSLLKSERELRDVIDTIPSTVWSTGPDGSNTYVNKHFVGYSGLSVDQTAGSGWKSAIHPDDLERHAAKWMEAVSNGNPHENEVRFRRSDGQYRWHLDRGVPLRDKDGNIAKWYGVVTDIEDRKRAEEALQRSQFYINEGQRLAHMGSWAFNPAGFFYYWSEELFKIYGLDLQKGAPTLEQYLATIHPQDRDFMANTIKSMHAEHCGCDVRKRIIRPDGELRYIRCVGIPVVEGEVLKGFLGTAMDITEQELLTQELKRRQAYLTEAQRLTHTASWAWRVPNREAVHLSDEFYRIYGFDPAKGSPTWEQYTERVHPEDRPQWRIIIERAIKEEADYDQAFRIVLQNGVVRWIHTVGHPVFSAAGDLEQFAGSSTDITAFKSAEQEREKLRQLEADLAHIDRVSTLGEMAASLAHEIKQPIAAAITSANTCIEWLAHDPPNLDRARAAATRIDKYGNRAAEIIDRMRSFYKKSPPQREMVDVNGIIREILTLLKGEATRSSIAMRTDLYGELPKIMVDRVQLQQVFMNLMLNGIEAMEDSGGDLTVKSEVRDGQLHFCVSDTGGGLPTENVDQIFSAFFTTKPRGSGMGLAISRSIVESHGGHLWASPNGGRGAVFHFTLPIQAPESSPLVT